MVSWNDARMELREIRSSQARNSARTSSLAITVISANRGSDLGEELWVVLEQGIIASLDCGKTALAKEWIEKLIAQFGKGSARVSILKGMYLEANERWDDAENLYSTLLENEPTNAAVMKRQIALLIARRKNPEAIGLMNTYLESFSGDFEAWMKLSVLYLEEGRLSAAQFCFEELILSNPHNHIYFERYAEILYTIGGPDNMALASKYFASAVKLNPASTRGLYGILLTSMKLSVKTAQNPESDLKLVVTDHLRTLYKESSSMQILEGMFSLIESSTD